MTAARRGEQGFALVAAIWFVALLALIAVIISGWMTRSLGLANRLQQRLAAHAALISAENEIAFDIVSGFFSARGLELPNGAARDGPLTPASPFGYAFAAATPYLALDDRPYRLGATLIRLQDDRGLYTLNFPNPLLLDPLLQHFGVPYEDQGVLINRLLDYMNVGANGVLHSVNGATADDYRQAGQLPPRVAPLLTPWEALRVLSWGDHAALWRGAAALPDLTTIGDFAQLNPNTAPEAILATLPGMNEDAAQRVIAYRQKYIIGDVVDLDRAADAAVAVDPMALMFFPAPSLDLTIAPAKEALVYRMRISVTSGDPDPYRISYVVALPADEPTAKLADDATLPQVPPAEPQTADPASGD
jgi:DNA uptake protein ComE-like DNA-binding protein